MSIIEEKCKQKGVRLTDQRKVIAKILSEKILKQLIENSWQINQLKKQYIEPYFYFFVVKEFWIKALDNGTFDNSFASSKFIRSLILIFDFLLIIIVFDKLISLFQC